MLPEFDQAGIRLLTISGDLVKDSYTAKLLEMWDPGLIERRTAEVGRLPTSLDIAEEVIRLLNSQALSGTVSRIW